MENWVVNPASTHTAESMICALAGMCDGAFQIDGAGFSRFDAEFGHSLANHANSGRPWTLKQASAALRIVRKYQRQLGGVDFINSWFLSPTFSREPSGLTSTQPSTIPKKIRNLISHDTTAIFRFDYDIDIVTAIKAIRGEHRGKKFWAAWDPSSKVWTVPVNETSIALIMATAERFEFNIEPQFVEYLNRIIEKNEENHTLLALNDGVNVYLAGDRIVIAIADQAIVNEFKKELEIA